MRITGRILHTMINVPDVDRTLAFYCGLLGMSVQADRSNATTGRRNVFIGYGPEAESALIELCSQADEMPYKKGDVFGHIAVGVDDVAAVCDYLRDNGVPVLMEPKTAMSGARIAFVEDPNGYRVELIQRAKAEATP